MGCRGLKTCRTRFGRVFPPGRPRKRANSVGFGAAGADAAPPHAAGLAMTKLTMQSPMAAGLAMTMLACARIGAVHSVVFAGFSAEALASRVKAANCATVVTGDYGMRGGKKINLKGIVDNAMDLIEDKELVKNVLVWERGFKEGETTAETEVTYETKEKDVRMDLLVADQRPFCAPEPMDAEDNLFILYTSGSTGQPKVSFVACIYFFF